jgi:hypothetical protein
MTALRTTLPYIGLLVAAILWAAALWRGQPPSGLPLALAALSLVELGRRTAVRHVKLRPAHPDRRRTEGARSVAGVVLALCSFVGPIVMVFGAILFRGEARLIACLLGFGIFVFPFVFGRWIFTIIDRYWGRSGCE